MAATPTPPVPTRITALQAGDVITSRSIIDALAERYTEAKVRADFTTPHITTLTITHIDIEEALWASITCRESNAVYTFDTDITLDLVGGRATYRQLREALHTMRKSELDTFVDYDRLMELATAQIPR